MLDVEQLTPPTDPELIDGWLDEIADLFAAQVRDSIRNIVRPAVEAWARTVIVAAGDAEPLDAVRHTTATLVRDEWGDTLGGMFHAGALTAWVQASPGIGQTGVNIEQLGDRFTAVVNEAAVAYQWQATNRIVAATDALWGDVRYRTVLAVREGWTNEELKDEIEKVTGFAEQRADAIARTETVAAYNGGNYDGAQALGKYGPVEKTWVATSDARTRPSHAEVDGQTIPMAASFMVGGTPMSRPHDPGAPAREVVQCRCRLVFLYNGDTRPDGSIVGEEPIAPPPAAEPESLDVLDRPWSKPVVPGEQRSVGLPKETVDHLTGRDLLGGEVGANARAKDQVVTNLQRRLGSTFRPTRADIPDTDVFVRIPKTGGGHTWSHDSGYSTLLAQSEGEAREKLMDVLRGPDVVFGYTDEIADAMQYDRINNLVAQWAGTSNDSNALSLAIQEAARREFGLSDAIDWVMRPALREQVEDLLAKQGNDLQAFVRAQYELTQDYFRERGITEVSAWRGYTWRVGGGTQSKPAWAEGLVQNATTEREVTLRPLSSVAFSKSAAESFVAGEGAVTYMTIPVERILSTARTGVGCMGEHEFVILAGPTRVSARSGQAFGWNP